MIFETDFVSNLALHTFVDIFYLIPYLYVTYLVLEYIEHRAHARIRNYIRSTRKFGPLVGALLSPVSGCGLSATAANFYVTRLISLGTLVAIYLATADEMLPLLISAGISGQIIIKILAFKIMFAAFIGFILDLYTTRKKQSFEINNLCAHDHCGCHHESIFKSAFIHTAQITVFIFIISFILNLIFELSGTEFLNDLISRNPMSSILMSAAIGLIPNCAMSVGLTQLYIENVLPIAALISGVLSNAGVGLLVFYKTSHSIKETVKIAGLLFLFSILGGNLALLVFG